MLHILFFLVYSNIFSSIQGTIKPCLDQLHTDTDIDVKFFASEAMLGKEAFLTVLSSFCLLKKVAVLFFE